MSDNVDVRFISEQLARVMRELADVKTEQANSAALLGRVADAVTAIAGTQEHHSGLLESINEVQANNGARLNVIDGRLAIIEKRIGLVQARGSMITLKARYDGLI